MGTELNNYLYEKTRCRNISISHVCEVGVYLPQTSNVIGFIRDGIRTTLVEPDPKCIDAIKRYFGEYKNVNLHPYAVFSHNGTLELVQRESSTFVSSLEASPALVNDRYQISENDKFTVECRKFDNIDDGSIDLLSVDTEGCEWYVIMNMKSRPKIISLETHGKGYVNPFYNEIYSWLSSNNYSLWYKDGSDSVFFKTGLFELSTMEKISLRAIAVKLFYKKWKHRCKCRIKSWF